MHIEDKSSYNILEHRQYDLETGVSISIDGAKPFDTQEERAEATADNAAAVIGRIVCILADKGLLDRDDVQFIIGGAFTVVDE